MIKKIFGYFFSIVFLPLFLPLYGTMFVLYSNPYLYPNAHDNNLMLLRVGINTFFIPAVAIGVMYRLKFIKGVEMYDRQDRVIPYIACGFFYIWTFYVFYREHFPPAITYVLLGSTIAVFVDFLVNVLVTKVSMHATGAGGMVATVMILLPYAFYNSLNIFLITILCAGCVGAARLALKAHTEREVYLGYLTGFFSFLLAYNFWHF